MYIVKEQTEAFFFLNENHKIGREILKAIKYTDQYRAKCYERTAEGTHVPLDNKRELSEEFHL